MIDEDKKWKKIEKEIYLWANGTNKDSFNAK